MEGYISDETMEYVEILAKLELSPKEREQAKKDMTTMLQYFDQLEELDMDDVEPMSHVLDVRNCFREDVVTNGDDSENMLRNAPICQNGMYQVPKTI